MMLFQESISVDNAKYILSLPEDNLKSEMYDPEELNESGGTWDSDVYIKSVKKFCRRVILNKGQLKQSYKFSNRLGNCGRRFVKGFGVQSLQHKIRGFLIGEYYYDIDIVNCHPSILLNIVKREFPEKSFPHLTNYVNNRADFLSNYKVSKKEVLIAMNSDKFQVGHKVDGFRKLDKEFKDIQKLIWNCKAWDDKYKDENKKNKYGSFLNTILCIEESEILDMAMKKVKVDVPMFDGFLVPKSIGDVEDVLNILNDLTVDMNIKWVMKPHNTDIQKEDWVVTDELVMDYETAKIQFEEKFFICRQPIQFIEECESGIYVYSKQDFTVHITEYEYAEINKNGEVEYKPIWNKWLKDKTKRSFRKLDFIPTYSVIDSDIYNTFQGFKYNGDHKIESDAVERFLNHLNLLVGNDYNSFEYLKHYLADLFQNPDKIPEVALVFKSMQGVGKDLMIDFIQKILGDEYVYRTANIDEVFDRFNGCLKHKLILQLNELQGQDGFSKKEKLKDMITTKSININEKNMKQYTLSNFMRLFIFSNNLSPIEIPHDDRRYCVFKCGQKQNREYYQALIKDLENSEALQAIAYYFKHVDLSNFDIKERPITDAYQQMQDSNSHPLYEFLFDTFGDNGDGTYTEDFENDYIVHSKTQNILIKPQVFQAAFKWFLQTREMTYVKHDWKTLKLLLEDIGIFQKKFCTKKQTTNYYVFDISAIYDNLINKGFEPPEVEEL